MTVPRKPKAKPTSIDETARVTRIWEWLAEWSDKRWPGTMRVSDKYVSMLAIAERIASRTED